MVRKKIWQHSRVVILGFFASLLYACAAQVQATPPASNPLITAVQPSEDPSFPTTALTTLPETPAATRTSDQAISLEGARLVEALRGGGYVILVSAAASDPRQSGSGISGLETCSLLSTIDEQDQLDAQALGEAFLSLNIPFGQVWYSQTCHSRDIALLAFGRADSWEQASESSITLHERLSTPPQPGTNTVYVVPTIDIPDELDNSLAESEAAILRPLERDGFELVARVLPTGWKDLEQDAPDLVQVESYDSGETLIEKVEPTAQSGIPLIDPEQIGGLTGSVQPNAAVPAVQSRLLPDLLTLPPSDLLLRTNPVDGTRLIRFTNSIMNNGPGRMELWGTRNPETGKVTVKQRIRNRDNSTNAITVGEFFFHPEHNHWHFGNFARYEILSLEPDGELKTVVAFSNKVSYCLRDDEIANDFISTTRQTYTSCNQETQGISVGWVDTYRYHLEGQSIDITSLSNGVYALRSTVNPDENLWELDYGNNSAILYIEIKDRSVDVIDFSVALKKAN